MDNNLIIKLILTIIFGAIVGLETETRELAKTGKEEAEKREKDKLGGLRTYTVISLFGGLAGILYTSGSYILSYFLLGSIVLFVLAAYVLNVQLKKAFGLTTEIAILITFIIGFFTTSSLLSVPVILVIIVLLTFFLSQKRGFGLVISKIEHREVIDLLKFGLISLIILPLLPNSNFSFNDILLITNFNIQLNSSIFSEPLFNPFALWFTVVLISGISLLTYILSKFLGSKAGLLLSGIFGGFISSTSTIISLSQQSKSVKDTTSLSMQAGSGIISNAVSVVTLALLIFINSTTLLFNLLPFFITFLLSGLIVGSIFYFRFKPVKNENVEIIYTPFSIHPAIKFVLMILGIRILIQFLTSTTLGEEFIIFITSLSGLSGIDAPSIAIAGLFNNNQLNLNLAVISIILTIFINILGKFIYTLFAGNKLFSRYLGLGMLASFIAAVIIQAL